MKEAMDSQERGRETCRSLGLQSCIWCSDEPRKEGTNARAVSSGYGNGSSARGKRLHTLADHAYPCPPLCHSGVKEDTWPTLSDTLCLSS